MAIGNPEESFGFKLCKILNLDPEKTKNITIRVVPDDVTMVQVDQYLHESDEVLNLIKEYSLKKKNES